jgi:hypothetical protein
MKTLARSLSLAALVSLLPVAPARAQDVTEPRSGVKFATKSGDMSLLGVGLRVRKIAFVSAKVYAIGLYVADSALAGPLAVHKGNAGSPAFYKDLVIGDFPKQAVLKFTRNVGQSRIQEAMREALTGADATLREKFVSYFPEVNTGQECILRWAPGGTLEVTMAGQARPPIADKAFATAVFAIWLGEKPIQEDIKKELVSRAPELMK